MFKSPHRGGGGKEEGRGLWNEDGETWAERETETECSRGRENTDSVIHGPLTEGTRTRTEQGSLKQLTPIMDFQSWGASGGAAVRLEADDFGPLPGLWPPLVLWSRRRNFTGSPGEAQPDTGSIDSVYENHKGRSCAIKVHASLGVCFWVRTMHTQRDVIYLNCSGAQREGCGVYPRCVRSTVRGAKRSESAWTGETFYFPEGEKIQDWEAFWIY